MDNDGDGLIEIWNLEQLDHMRHNLGGTSYKATSAAAGSTTGCGTGTLAAGGSANACHGYELMNNLDFRVGCGDAGTAASGACTYPDWVPQDASGNIAAPADGTNDGWIPIGTLSDFFTGTFEGNNHTLANLYVNLKSAADDAHAYAGLFGVSTGTSRNLGLTGSHMAVSATATHNNAVAYAGGLVGRASGIMITNFRMTGNVSASTTTNTSSYAGGLVGYAAYMGNITGCRVEGNVSSSSSGSHAYAGGLFGGNSISNTPEVTDSHVTGNVSSSTTADEKSSYAGGLVGYIFYEGEINFTNCSATGNVSASSGKGPTLVGGLVGLDFGSHFTSCYATGNVESTGFAQGGAYSSAGGLIGSVSSSKVTNCYATGTVSNTDSSSSTSKLYYSTAGGLVGYFRYESTITNSRATGDVSVSSVSGKVHAGGLVGRTGESSGATVRNSYAAGDVSVSSVSGEVHAGGLVGLTRYNLTWRVRVTDCYATGGVSVSDTSSTAYAGGLVGFNDISEGYQADITSSYATGDVTVPEIGDNFHAGGVLGGGEDGVTLCYHSGDVKVDGGLGAIVAQVTSRYRTTTQLKAFVAGAADENDPTKSGWDGRSWDFGTNQQLPRLRSYKRERVAVNRVEQVQGDVLDGQSSLEDRVPESALTTPVEKKLAVLEDLVGGPTQDAAVDGSVYQRIKQLVSDVEAVREQLRSSGGGGSSPDLSNYALRSELPDISGKADVGASYTKGEADAKYALSSEVGAKPNSGTEATLWAEVAAVKSSIPDVSGKADVGASYTTADSDARYALSSEVGAKPSSGTEATLWAEVAAVKSSVPDVSGKADVGTSYTKEEADDKYALQTGLDAVSRRLDTIVTDSRGTTVDLSAYPLKSELPDISGKADVVDLRAAEAKIRDLETVVGAKPNSGTAATLWQEVAAVKSSIPDAPDLSRYALKSELPIAQNLSGKADVGASYTKQESDDKYALSSEVGAKPSSGTEATLWQEVAAVKSSIPDAPDLSRYALKSELPTAQNLSGKADVGASYTKQESDDKYALKSELPTAPDLSGYALRVDLSSKASVGASYTREETDRREAALKAELEALRKALEDLKKQVGSGTGSGAFAAAWLETRITVKPNPVQDRLVVSSPVSVAATLLDAKGNTLLSRQLSPGEQTIDVSELSVGNYLLVLQTETGVSSTHKFVKE